LAGQRAEPTRSADAVPILTIPITAPPARLACSSAGRRMPSAIWCRRLAKSCAVQLARHFRDCLQYPLDVLFWLVVARLVIFPDHRAIPDEGCSPGAACHNRQKFLSCGLFQGVATRYFLRRSGLAIWQRCAAHRRGLRASWTFAAAARLQNRGRQRPGCGFAGRLFMLDLQGQESAGAREWT
jgi:hypothetical protein